MADTQLQPDRVSGRTLAERTRALLGGVDLPSGMRPEVAETSDCAPGGDDEGSHAPEHVAIAEAFLRGTRDEVGPREHLCLVGAVDEDGALCALEAIGPEELRSHSSAIQSGVLLSEIPVCTVSRRACELLAAVFRVERSDAMAKVIEAVESLSTAAEYAGDDESRAALMASMLDRMELLARSARASMVVGGSLELRDGGGAGSGERYTVLSTNSAPEEARYFVKNRHLSRGHSSEAARPVRSEDFILFCIGPAPARSDPSRIQQLRRQYALLEGGQVLGEADAALESYHEKARRLRLANRLTALYGARGARRVPAVTPIALEISGSLKHLLVHEDGLSSEFAQKLGMMRDGLRYELGVEFPGAQVRANETVLPQGKYNIIIDEVPIVSGNVMLGKILVNETLDRLALLDIKGEKAVNPANGNECALVPREHEKALEDAGLTVWHPDGYVVLHLSSVLRKNASSFLSLEAVSGLLQQKAPGQLDAIKAASGGLPRFASVLRALVADEVPIHELKLMSERYLEVLEQPTYEIPEELRALDPVRTERHWNKPETPIYKLGEKLTRLIENGIKRDGEAAVLALEPQSTQEALAAVRNEVANLPPMALNPVMFVDDWRLRSFVRRLIELEFPHLWVVSRREADHADTMPVLATIEID